MNRIEQQRDVARARANEVRFARSTIKRELRNCADKPAALRMCAQHLADPVGELAAMAVFDLIAAGRGCGTAAALGLLNAADVSPGTKVGHPDSTGRGFLTARQRADLVAALNADPVVRVCSSRVPRFEAVPPIRPVVRVEPPCSRPVPEPDDGKRPSLSRWCSTCGEYALPMRNGTCGFCDTRIEEAA